jgi:CBS domain-containing protein
VWAIPPDASVYEAIKLMADKEVGALLVMDGQRLVGIVSERDYARKVILQGKSSRDTPIREIMTGKVFYVRPDQTVEDCMALMTARRIRHLPVLDDDRVIGVVSIGDLVKAVISEQEVRIQQLEQYIMGR